MKHTPGPYRVESDEWSVRIHEGTGNLVAEFTIAVPYGYAPGRCRPISPDEAMANAQLWLDAAERGIR